MATKLTQKQERFCIEYVRTGNASEAYRSAYNCKKMKPATIHRKAKWFLDQDKIRARIDELTKPIREEAQVDSTYVLNRLVEIDQMDVVDILNDDGTVKDIRAWPKVWRQFLSGMDLSEIFSGRGEEKDLTGIIKKIKWPDKVKNLELIGKHVAVQAFKEVKEHTGKDGKPIEHTVSQVKDLSREELMEIAAGGKRDKS